MEKISTMKTKLQSPSQLRGENMKALKELKSFFKMHSVGGGSLVL